MKYKFNKYLLISFSIIIILIGVSFYNFYKPYYKYANEYNLIKENCYEKKNLTHEFCQLPYYQNEENLKFYIENNDPQKELEELDLYTVTLTIIEKGTFSIIQFLSPLIIMIVVIGTIHSEYSSGMFKNYLMRVKYKDYVKEKYKFVLKSALIIPISLILIFIISCVATGFNTNVAEGVKEIAVYNDFKYSNFYSYFIGICIIQYFMSIFFANIGLFCIKKTKNSLLAIVLGYILFIIIDIIIYVILYALILLKIFNLNLPWEIFNITGYWFASSKNELILLFISSIILQFISLLCLSKFYKNKEEVIEKSEKQTA